MPMIHAFKANEGMIQVPGGRAAGVETADTLLGKWRAF